MSDVIHKYQFEGELFVKNIVGISLVALKIWNSNNLFILIFNYELQGPQQLHSPNVTMTRQKNGLK